METNPAHIALLVLYLSLNFVYYFVTTNSLRENEVEDLSEPQQKT